MLYDANAKLPDWVKDAFPEEIQTAYRKAFDAALQQYNNDEDKAAAVAISAIQKMGYIKKGDKWIKAEYVKDLGLKPGEYLHPNNEGEKLNIVEQDLKNYVKNTMKIIESGGTIPLTISHPKTEREKIENNEGDILSVWYDEEEQTPYMAFNPSDIVKGWIKEGKLKAVSPGIYHDVITSIGKLPSLIDHVALTNSPFNIQQNGFLPINAEKFGKAILFFENKYISYEEKQGGDILGSLKSLFEYYFGKSTTLQGGKKMELEQAKEKIIELEAQGKKDREGIKTRDETILERDKKIEEYEKKEKERIETERKNAIAEFEAKVDKLIKEKKVEPKNREKLINDYTTLYENKIENADKILLERFGDPEPIKSKLEHNVVIIEKEQIDYSTEAGRDKLSKIFNKRANELAKADGEKTANQFHEQAMDEVCEEYGIDQESIL